MEKKKALYLIDYLFFSLSILAQDQYVLHGAVLIDVVSVTTTASLQSGPVTTFCRCFFIGSTLVA